MKNNITGKITEELLELGKSVAQNTATQMAKTFNPFTLAEQIISPPSKDNLEKQDVKKGKNFTPLDTKKLRQKYDKRQKENDQAKLEALRKRLFQQIKQEEIRYLEEQKLKELEKKRKEEEEQRKKEEEKRKKEKEVLIEPEGKVRRSIFAPLKRKIKSKLTEFKAGSGKS